MKTLSINKPMLRSLLILSSVIEARDAYTGGHTWRVSHYARALADDAGLSAHETFIAYIGGLVHDLGKVSVPDRILNKRGKLTKIESATIRKHPAIGQTLVERHPLAPLLLDGVSRHHEQYDGAGYPVGIAGDQIPIIARIITIADAFDAITSPRAYRREIELARAFDIVLAASGKQFDPGLAARFVQLGRAGKFDAIIGRSAAERTMQQCATCGPLIVLPSRAQAGDFVYCPGCTGKYLVDIQRGELTVQWIGVFEPALVPQADLDTVEEAVKRAPRQIKL